MFNVGGAEILVIALVALLVLGPDKLPGAARTAGNVMRQIRDVSQGFQRELKQAIDEADPRTDGAPTPSPTGRGDVHPGAGAGPTLPATTAVVASGDEVPTATTAPAPPGTVRSPATGLPVEDPSDQAQGTVRTDGPSASFS